MEEKFTNDYQINFMEVSLYISINKNIKIYKN